MSVTCCDDGAQRNRLQVFSNPLNTHPFLGSKVHKWNCQLWILLQGHSVNWLHDQIPLCCSNRHWFLYICSRRERDWALCVPELKTRNSFISLRIHSVWGTLYRVCEVPIFTLTSHVLKPAQGGTTGRWQVLKPVLRGHHFKVGSSETSPNGAPAQAGEASAITYVTVPLAKPSSRSGLSPRYSNSLWATE